MAGAVFKFKRENTNQENENGRESNDAAFSGFRSRHRQTGTASRDSPHQLPTPNFAGTRGASDEWHYFDREIGEH